jgi:hypothetical protein
MSDETLREKYDRLSRACDEEEKHADGIADPGGYWPEGVFNICRELLDMLRPIAYPDPEEGPPK